VSTPAATVRPAAVGDVPTIARLEEECLGVDAWSQGLVHEGVIGALPTVVYLVADVEGEVVGHAVASMAGDIAELQRIAVDPAARRSGIASRLLAAVVEAAGRTEADRLLLEVRADNRGALAFYDRHGLTEIDRRPRYYADGATAVVMLLPLGAGGPAPVDQPRRAQ
jgi:[ribosomal protein S18]-alanine N-acetyltransferase